MNSIDITILENALDGIIIIRGEDEYIEYANPAVAQLLGYDVPTLLGRPLAIILPWEDTCRHRDKFLRRLQADADPSFAAGLSEVTLMHRDGDHVAVEVKAFELAARCGKRRFAGFIRDIRERKCLEERLQATLAHMSELAYTDELTGLPNRRAFLQQLEKVRAIVRRHEREAVIGIIDIDHFKHINDDYGHLIGDKVLRETASLLSSYLRTEDVIGRLGGEEFGFLLMDTNLERGLPVAERLRQAVARHRTKISASLRTSVTVSIGITEIQPDVAATFVLHSADTALYDAKHNGRNCVKSRG